MNTTDFNNYLSPFSWRYGSEKMRSVWSEHNKRLLWRKIWVACAEVQSRYDLVTPKQIADLRANSENIDIPRALEIEKQIQHDVVSEIKTYAEQCSIGGGRYNAVGITTAAWHMTLRSR